MTFSKFMRKLLGTTQAFVFTYVRSSPDCPTLINIVRAGLCVRRAHALMGAGVNGSAGGGRAARALRLLLLLVLALAAVEYLFGSILDASPLRTYLYTPLYNATQPTIR